MVSLPEKPLLAPIHMVLVFFKFIFWPEHLRETLRTVESNLSAHEASDNVAVMSFA